ncbi:MAG TPA: HD domain-containing phosphohydrolase [Polyangiaceae bacterium]|jgi:HD-GYP domain-containing protein (c-di-GMP phosphodiesterase class II)|nr:HD domain-containing phosphohydrolase [Polyangiaceae bacterium]
MSEIRALSPRARATVDRLAALAAWLSQHPAQSSDTVTRPHPLLLLVRRAGFLVLIAPASVWDQGRDLLGPYLEKFAAIEARLVLLGRPRDPDLNQALNLGLCALLAETPAPEEVFVALHQAFELMDVKARSESRGKWLTRYRYELGELIEIARALTTEREIDKLLNLILEKARFICGADAGSMYVVDGDDPVLARRQLHFKLSQNDSVSFDSREFAMPISARSMAGYVALEQKTLRIDDVYDMPAGSPFGFDRSFDQKVGYRTRSMLVTPLITSKGEVIGVLQLINKKREPKQKLLSEGDFDRSVVPFDERSEQLVATLAAQAGIALENAILYQEIRKIFEGFVKASVDAIEARDPTTSGHSRRVADLTVNLAAAVERTDSGPYRDVRWQREDLREIEYASVLHDFGKIGVREHVLVKAKKLFPHEVELIQQRFEFVIRTLEFEIIQRKMQAMSRGASAAELAALDAELAEKRAEIEEAWGIVAQANEPSVLAAGNFQRIEELGRRAYARLSGEMSTLLSADEVKSLSVMRGSLTAEEFDEIRSHVSHTYRFLSQIPWGKTFSRVAIIAGSHHERLNGTGYPNRLRAEEIPLQSKMMSISDIFDALTASDRPYKRAVPVQKALDILGFEVKDNHVDGELVRIFTEAKVWESVVTAPASMR